MKRSEWVQLVRQLTAHDGYVARRALREGLAYGLACLGRRWPAAARGALRVHESSREAHRALAEWAEKRGDAATAAPHRERYDQLAHNSLEISVLGALRTTLSRRRSSADPGGPGQDIGSLVAAGRLDEAAERLDSGAATPGARVDGLLALARAAADRGEPERADAWLARALSLDAGRADAWVALGALARAAGRLDEARTALERAARLDPVPAETWCELALACAELDPTRAREAAWEALRRRPELDEPLGVLEGAADTPRPAAGSTLSVEGAPGGLRPGESATLRVQVRGAGPGAALYVIEPFALGVLASPRGRVAIGPGDPSLELTLRAQRPDAANGGRPWRLVLALLDAGRVERLALELAVPDLEPGVVHYLITEDHELYDERESTDAAAAATTLVDKSRLAERIANEEGAVWTHMVDVGSLQLLPWAAERSDGPRWGEVARQAREHLIESVAAGNDLGLHCHGFHDPGTHVFCHDFDPETDRVTTPPGFLERGVPERGFWSRAFPVLGDAASPGTRAWATWRGIGALEALGRLGDPRFRVALFRAGSFDFGDDAGERARSLALLQRLGVLGDSDVPKPRLYHRPMTRSSYPVDLDPRAPVADPARMRTLEIRAEYNLEADFLSDTRVLNGYLDARMASLRDGDTIAPGVHVICSMTHDKFINFRMGRRWDSLEAGYGDWATIRDHLAHAARQHPELRFSRPRDAVLDWYDRYTPALVAWRDEEIVELAPVGARRERFRYALRLLGRDIPVSPERPQRVEVLPPAWLHERILDLWVERGGARVEAWRGDVEPAGLLFDVDSRDDSWELVVEAEPGDGIEALPVEEGLRLHSVHGYRRASVDVPAELAADGVPRRVRGVALEPSRKGYEAILPA
ncbi:MAG: tetratricopeptide repeat protein [Myxococcota bacterium]